ncbi:hypothetical protein [Maribacter sp. ACAM166]|uniref:hypothetical protein n=1 Tax=Maribacter sp. ACAM166 TaxID=2508996 RepID=UPI0010FE1DED|nr:hypothetical protein [Maribacter sp. ACAM166]TLP70127.1 hypothetical protein ES765_21465 [Maribacter sp. ACAM166]
MDTKYYTCRYCHEEFLPKRRHVQKFCSASCRSKDHHQKNKTPVLKPTTTSATSINKIDKMSAAAIGNSTAGTLAADALKFAFTKHNDKPATKGDILALKSKIQRYQKIINMQMRPDGAIPHFDMETKNVVYLKHNMLSR